VKTPCTIFLVAMLSVMSVSADSSNSLSTDAEALTNTVHRDLVVTNIFEPAYSNIEVTLKTSFKAVSVAGLKVSPGTGQSPTIIFSRGSDRYVFTPEPRLCYTDPVLRDDGRVVFFIVRRYSGWGKPGEVHAIMLDYHCLARFDIPNTATPLSKTVRRLVLDEKDLEALLENKRAWVRSIEEISSDGKRLRIEVSVEDRTRSPKHIEYVHKEYWYWLSENRLSDAIIAQ
jgi:hypothetical protein